MNNICHLFFALLFIFVFYLEFFSFFRLSVSVILSGWNRVGFCIYNPVRSVRLAGRLNFVVFGCVMLLLLQLFVEVYESLSSSLMDDLDEQRVK